MRNTNDARFMSTWLRVGAAIPFLLASGSVLADETVPPRAEGLRAIAVAFEQQDKHDEALAAINKAIEIAPQWAELRFLRAGIHKRIAAAKRAAAPGASVEELTAARVDLDAYEKMAPDAPDLARVDGELIAIDALKKQVEEERDNAAEADKHFNDEESAAWTRHWIRVTVWTLLMGGSAAAGIYGLTHLQRNCTVDDTEPNDPGLPIGACLAIYDAQGKYPPSALPNLASGKDPTGDYTFYYDSSKQVDNTVGKVLMYSGAAGTVIFGAVLILELVSLAPSAAKPLMRSHARAWTPSVSALPVLSPNFSGILGTF